MEEDESATSVRIDSDCFVSQGDFQCGERVWCLGEV